jgi:deoxyribodipyrimidine photolyase
MKNHLAAILLATLATTSIAEPRSRQVRFMCGSLQDVQVTMEKYGEKLVIATQAPNETTVNLLYVNFETQTSSWFLHDVDTDEYCMMGVGKAVLIPDGSPLQKGTGIGTKVSH